MNGTEQNEKEIETAIALSKRHRNIDSIIVGNETLYRSSVLNRGPGVQDLIAKIQRVKRQVSVPVTTAEVWNIWLEHPELASAVDYLAVHILPYWEGLPSSVAVDHAIKIYQRLRQAYPGKRIVIAEFGWPSAGLNRLAAVPDPVAQADIIRDFVARADAMGIDYSIVEAFDQPWKTFEGSVGAYWGMFDTDRAPKFALAGSVETPNWVLKTVAAARHRALALHPDLRQSRRDAHPGRRVRRHGARHRRLGLERLRLLGDPLLRARLADRHDRRRHAARAARRDHEAAPR